MSLSPLNPHPLDAERSLPDATGVSSLLPVPAGALAPDLGAQGGGFSNPPGGLESPRPKEGTELAEAAPNRKSARQWQEAERRHRLVQLFRSLQAQGLSGREAADEVRQADAKCSHATLFRWDRDERARGFAGLFDNRELAGRPRIHRLHEKETRALKAAYLAVNHQRDRGSVPEAVKLAARRGQLPAELVAEFQERERTGRMVPRALAQEIMCAPAVVRQHRNPTDTALDFLKSPGALMWLTDPRTGAKRFCKAGDIFEADDATINFPVCVPWDQGGDPCAERWGVRVARFQWLVAIDRGTRFVPGYRYTARPRSSYRAEDIAGLFHALFRQHGIWQRACLERGTWEAKQITELLRHLGVERMTAWSPHQKPFIEGLFDTMWRKLSDLPGQVGRFRGEEEETNRVLTSCQRGATDPKLHFPLLATAVAAFDRAIAEHNAETVVSPQWGRWVPQERWLAQQAEARAQGRLRPLPAEAAWLFAPCLREWTVQGNCVGGSVQFMEGLSVRLDFAAEWLVAFDGCKVRCHFDPFAPAPGAEATVVLAQNVRDHRAGEVLGVATQINVTAAQARLAFGLGEDRDHGLDIRRATAMGLRARTRTTLAGGHTGLTVDLARDGLGNSVTVESGREGGLSSPPSGLENPRSQEPAAPRPTDRRTAALTPPRQRRGTNPFAEQTPEAYARKADRNARLAAAQRRTVQPVPA